MKHTEQLKEWLIENAVQFSWSEFSGIKDMSLADLGSLQVLVQAAIEEKIKQE